MVLPTVPCFVQIKQIVGGVLLVFYVRRQAVAHANRIEQYAVWILQHPEFYFFQVIANVFGKARTNQQQLIVVRDKRLKGFKIYVGKKLHRLTV